MTGMWSNITDEDIENADNTVQNPNEGDIFGSGSMDEETEPAAINDTIPLVDVLDWNEKEHPRRSNGQFSTNKDKNANIAPSARGTNYLKVKGFSNKQKLMNHWKNGRTHRDEYPDLTMEQYVATAVKLAESPVGGDILGHIDKNDDVIRYNVKTNDFVKASLTKGIRTMFKPDEGFKYYQRMLEGDLKHGGRK